MTDQLLDRDALLRAFAELDAELRRRRVVGELHVFGGAAMILAFDGRDATRDVDALFQPDGPVIEAALAVARRMNIPVGWLNNQASTYVSSLATPTTVAVDRPNLRVLLTPPEHLLAMKIMASRSDRDINDLQLLLDYLKIDDRQQALDITRRFFPDIDPPARALLVLDELLPA